MDMNERALINVTVGQEGRGVERKDHFDITAASEIMAVLCLATDIADLKRRLGNIIVGLNLSGDYVLAKDIPGAVGSMAVLLKDAMKPNLVQTLEGTPAFIHGGPFANIAHGCNSVQATYAAMGLAEYAVTEAGFGADLGAEKFLDTKCRVAGIEPDCVVIVATVKALKLHGGAKKEKLASEDLATLEKGLPHLLKHVETIKNVYKKPVVVAMNRFVTDTTAEDWDKKELRTRATYFLLNGVPEFSVNQKADGRLKLLSADKDFYAVKAWETRLSRCAYIVFLTTTAKLFLV